MSQMMEVGGAIVCFEPMEEVRRKPDGEPRWCFKCRKVRAFEFVVTAPVERFSYYGPNANVECTVCKTDDGDCFPGRYRMWGEE